MSNPSGHSDPIGRTIVISVGEPWNFSSSDGDNVLKARIVEVLAAPTAETTIWIAECREFFEAGPARGKYLAIAVRHYKDDLARTLLGEQVPISGGLIVGQDALPIPSGFQTVPFIIGSIRMVF